MMDDNRYEIPKVKNYPFYIYGCFAKLFCYLFFGTGAMVLAIVVFPLLRLIVHPKLRFQRAARCVVCYTFKFFIGMLRALGLVTVTIKGGSAINDADGKAATPEHAAGGLYRGAVNKSAKDIKRELRELKSCVVVANHPSMLDVVFVISFIPNADCIVRGNLAKTVYSGVIKQLYIVNTLDNDELMSLCKKSLATGTNLIIFPEGTRTPHGGTNPFKKGASRIAHDAQCNIKPIYIGGNEKYGLGKGDPFLSYSRQGRYHYCLNVLDEIDIKDYTSLTPQVAAKRLTDKMHSVIANEAMLSDGRKV